MKINEECGLIFLPIFNINHEKYIIMKIKTECVLIFVCFFFSQDVDKCLERYECPLPLDTIQQLFK